MIKQSLTLPNGVILKNRIVKSAMSEALADANNDATQPLMEIFSRWSHGGAALLILGNTPVDRLHLEHAGNFVLDKHSDLNRVKQLVAAAKSGGALVFAQLSHAGRQTPAAINPEPLSVSNIQLNLPGYAQPKAATDSELADVIAKFQASALTAQEAGFDGVQIHAAHGYLLSSSLSARINTRSDNWGGDLPQRARLLLRVVAAVRETVSPRFVVACKLNSSDFQKGGFSHDESIAVAKMLQQQGVDFIEISGGNFETPVAYKHASKSESSVAREAYFLEYARDIKAALNIPVMVTGGFRSLSVMNQAIANNDADLIGMGRPFIIDPLFVNKLLKGEIDMAPAFERELPPAKKLPAGAALNWFCHQLMVQAMTGSIDLELPVNEGHEQYLADIQATTQAMLEARKMISDVGHS